MTYTVYLGDCLDVLPTIESQSIDAVIADPPYGQTACKWDSVIPLEPMWAQLKRVIKLRGAIVLFGSQPFTTELIQSNRIWFKYCLYWRKTKPNGWQHAKNKPMRAIEEIIIFSPGAMGHRSLTDNRMTYNPQGITSVGPKIIQPYYHGRTMGKRPNQVGREYEAMTGFPCDVLEFPNMIGKQAIHPTQKPVALLEYLIRTYTNEGETVLDFTMGSGSTGVACLNTGRKFIGIEKDATYYAIACSRLADYQAQAQQSSLFEGQ